MSMTIPMQSTRLRLTFVPGASRGSSSYGEKRGWSGNRRFSAGPSAVARRLGRLSNLWLFVAAVVLSLPVRANAQVVPATTGEPSASASLFIPDPLELRAGWWEGLGIGTDAESQHFEQWLSRLAAVDRDGLTGDGVAELEGVIQRVRDWKAETKPDELPPLPEAPSSVRQLLSVVERLADLERDVEDLRAQESKLDALQKQSSARVNAARDAYLNDREKEPSLRKAQGWKWVRLWLAWKVVDREQAAGEKRLAKLGTRARELSALIGDGIDKLRCGPSELQYWRYQNERNRLVSHSSSMELLDQLQSIPELSRTIYLQEQQVAAHLARFAVHLCKKAESSNGEKTQVPLGPDPDELIRWVRDARKVLELKRLELSKSAVQVGDSNDARSKEHALADKFGQVRRVEADLRRLSTRVQQYSLIFSVVSPKNSRVWTEVKTGWGKLLGRADDFAHQSLFSVNDYAITPLDFVRFVAILFVTWFVSRALRAFVAKIEVSRGLTPSLVFLLRRLIHYTVVGAGVLIALSTMGIDLTKFAIFASAVGVGLGLGLQSLTKNFVAGFVVLFERSLKIGDFIELESGIRGIVREINLRGTVITTPDNIDIMIPNSEFVDGRVTN